MTALSVNINKIATLRNARGGRIPDVVRAAVDIERFGADGITVHPRPDERHITRADVYALAKAVTTAFNIEGYPDERFMAMVLEVKPAQATLVPDPPGVLTSNAGWQVSAHRDLLAGVIATLKKAGIRTSLFVAPDADMVRAAADTGADRIELYTESYAHGFEADPAAAVAPFVAAAAAARACGLGINAGHDLSLQNLRYFKEHIPGLHEVSIGHALISDALYYGLENTVNMYKYQLR